MNDDLRFHHSLDAAVEADLDRRLCALLFLCFPHEPVLQNRRFVHLPPHERWFLTATDGRVVAHVAAHRLTVRTRTGRLQMAGIAEVACHPDWRGQGLIRRLMESAHRDLQTAQVSFSILFGKPEVYDGMGYRRVDNPVAYCKPDGTRVEAPCPHFCARALGDAPWPEGLIDLDGPLF